MYLFKIQQPFRILLFIFILLMPSYAQSQDTGIYHLSLAFNPSQNQLTGTAKISVPAGQGITLYVDELQITGSLLREARGKEYQLSDIKNIIELPPHQEPRELFISYTYTSSNSRTNVINDQAISLTDQWFPIPREPMLFRVTASLPDQFSAIVEADSFPLSQQGDTVTAAYSIPTTQLHFVAGPYITQKIQVRDDFFVYTMFFREDQKLADEFLEAARSYLLYYEKTIGRFPYNHYVIVANRLPTGYGMPTFTLLGQMVLRLPFIKSSSLGHEIVHSWFGNSVEVKGAGGNWCEGLTSYLADHHYKVLSGEDINYRKELITKYLSYAGENSPISLTEFNSASHHQKLAETKRAVGYNRGSLFFHELNMNLGDETFRRAIQHFYQHNKNRQASWEDIQTSFEYAAAKDLSQFFSERLTRRDIPKISIKNIVLDYKNSLPRLTFDLIQETTQPYNLTIPIRVKTSVGNQEFTREISELESKIIIDLQQRPSEFVVDPEHSFLRTLSTKELPPVWSHFLGSDSKMIILENESAREKYKAIVDTLQKYEPQTRVASAVTNSELSKHDLLFLGLDQPPLQSLFGGVDPQNDSFTLDTRQNPLNRKYVAVLMSGTDQAQVSSAVHKLRHYTKYSKLQFNLGRNVLKEITNRENGLHVLLENLPQGSSTSHIKNFDDILQELAKNRVVYVGESHTSLSDHLLQLRIIEGLQKLKPDIAIGMEMFPTSSQAALDKYTLHQGVMDEQTFLKESDYYEVWRYDYRYFRDIFNFARSKQIPVLGLNVKREIVSKVFKEGNTDVLNQAEKDSLAAARDLDMEGYSDRLEQIYAMHSNDGHAAGQQSGFIQAQAIWDESMAENIATFLQANPKHTMIVLAGSQHTRKDSGIPPRVARRIPVKQISVLNVYNDNPPLNLSEIADYFFFSSQQDLPESPKIGIILNPVPTAGEPGKAQLTVEQISPNGKAAEAGLRVGDIITRVKGISVTTMAELKIAMLDTKPGDTIDIEVTRTEGAGKTEHKLRVELTNPQRPPGHP